ncbi:CapA family protein [Acanthopleuribacter pedis]|uniref:CapA family protein n=1 Tax=Acanthopleuribacter pedis TaxID=442870 RepID=A0A8J7QMH2_9BACT|nr:CapA family protein [Acanthopleuribacter pedis]MBO1321098.1 CapA family protein [Acanthopleuribacter pedis]
MKITGLIPLITAILIASTILGCSGSYDGETPVVTEPPPPTNQAGYSVHFLFQDENGDPVANAVAFDGTRSYRGDASGRVTVDNLNGPTALVVTAPDILDEPMVADPTWAETQQTRRLWRRAGGTRWSMHAGGDAMFGRRYLNPAFGEPLIREDQQAADAAAVIQALQPLFVAADFRTVNLETSVSDLDETFAYPGKRFILNAPTQTMAALIALGTDLVILANNHVRDYGDTGVAATLQALDRAGLTTQGAGMDETTATTPTIQTVAGTRIGTLSYTTVTGSFVNDNYPGADDPIPDDLPPTEAWQYEARSWQFDAPGWQVPAAQRRIGVAWRLFSEAESDLEQAERDAAWASLERVYPELQDWVARRGHGGAAFWRTADVRTAIETLAARTDLVIIQLHAGFQYQEVPSESLRRNARRAIDAGADIVICHHPHVLQSVEWYRGKLIAYSLGNFVFDQDFLVTFPSAFLRTVWEGNQLLEARLVPFEIQRYQPAGVAGPAATRTLLNLWEMNRNNAQSLRDAGGTVRPVAIEPDDETVAADLIRIGNQAGIVTRSVAPQTRQITLGPGENAALPDNVLVHARLGLGAEDTGVEIGRDLYGWGRFEDDIADGAARGDTHWNLDGVNSAVINGDARSGNGFLRIQTQSNESEARLIRPLARVPLPEHRLYREGENGVAWPLDPPAAYSLRFFARRTGEAVVWTRFDLYEFIDTDPTAEPESTLLRTIERALSLPADGAWHAQTVALSAADVTSESVRANALNFYAVLGPAQTAQARLEIDDLAFIEWRRAGAMPDRFGRYERVRNNGTTPIVLTFEVLPL